jgi:hypothetical protein
VGTTIELAGGGGFAAEGTRTVLAGNPRDQNNEKSPGTVVPVTGTFAAGGTIAYEAPAYSLTVFRVKRAK